MKYPNVANDNLRNDLIRRTRRIWQPRLERDLSCEDARQIVENVSGFFAVLADWSRAEQAKPANDNEGDGDSTAATSYELMPAAEGGALDHG